MKILMLIILITISTICFYIIIRNNYVYRFKTNLNDLGYSILSKYLNSIDPQETDDDTFNELTSKFDELREIWNSINDISYNKMLCSLRSLKPDRWLTKEQLEFLKL